MTRFLLALLLCLTSVGAPAAMLVASVDRLNLSQGETVELTLETDDPAAFGKPDLSPLHDLFDVLGSRQVKITTSGQTRAPATRWMITLQPTRTGYVVIPPIALGEAKSEPITLHVHEAATPNGEALAPVFIDASLDQDSPYVQAQVVLTLRIFHSVSLYDDSSLTPLQMPDAHVEKLGDTRTYEQVIGGVRHGVIELRYAIYPQRSGEINIPAQEFSATLVDRSVPNTFTPFGPRPGKTTRVQSPSIPLHVRPKPADYPADALWLPARSLTLTEVWTPDPLEVDALVGESLTRNLMLRAEGLSSAQLPTLPNFDLDGIRSYADQPRLANQSEDNGIIGSREESQALVPTRAGSYEIPPIEVVWWNTALDRLERTRLSGRTLTAIPDPAYGAQRLPTVANGTEPILSSRPWPWQALSFVFFCTTLLGFGLWWRARRKPAVLAAAPAGPDNRTLLDDLRKACQANDTHATRHALDAWARQQPETLAEMAARFEPLSDALNGLNGALYSESGHQWQGTGLWRAIRELPPPVRPEGTQEEDASLPPLYPK
ncbi:BatD family protein [Pseudomonas sp. Marseille-QA0892]